MQRLMRHVVQTWKRTTIAILAGLLAAGCTIKDADTSKSTNGAAGSKGSGSLSGIVSIDGSSTVELISKACAEEFNKLHRDVRVEVGAKGTGGGFKRFCVGETDINDASRPIKESEIELCKQNGIEFAELKIALDGLSVVVNKDNDWCECLTAAQLKRIWEPGSTVKTWRDVDPEWPEEEIRLYGPDTDSGTFEYFTETICGETGASRTDYQASADDNFLVLGVAGDRASLGYFGYGYYAVNQDKVRAVGVSAGSDPADCVIPTDETIKSGEYAPLSRPLFLYVNKASLKKPQVAAFLEYYLTEGQKLVRDVRYVELPAATVEESRETLRRMKDEG